ncbi:MAG: hypothetical protein A4E50_01354 [Methanosaeta sp. PtaB.Bin087]|nr:MAG: hypothetical protein A4E50_01354 [Methanosaeta sp. PtaB.Bin087]
MPPDYAAFPGKEQLQEALERGDLDEARRIIRRVQRRQFRGKVDETGFGGLLTDRQAHAVSKVLYPEE